MILRGRRRSPFFFFPFCLFCFLLVTVCRLNRRGCLQSKSTGLNGLAKTAVVLLCARALFVCLGRECGRPAACPTCALLRCLRALKPCISCMPTSAYLPSFSTALAQQVLLFSSISFSCLPRDGQSPSSTREDEVLWEFSVSHALEWRIEEC